MSFLTFVILLGVAATLWSFLCGVSTMAVHGDVRHGSGEKWMFRRVGFQAATVALLVAAAAFG